MSFRWPSSVWSLVLAVGLCAAFPARGISAEVDQGGPAGITVLDPEDDAKGCVANGERFTESERKQLRTRARPHEAEKSGIRFSHTSAMSPDDVKAHAASAPSKSVRTTSDFDAWQIVQFCLLGGAAVVLVIVAYKRLN